MENRRWVPVGLSFFVVGICLATFVACSRIFAVAYDMGYQAHALETAEETVRVARQALHNEEMRRSLEEIEAVMFRTNEQVVDVTLAFISSTLTLDAARREGKLEDAWLDQSGVTFYEDGANLRGVDIVFIYVDGIDTPVSVMPVSSLLAMEEADSLACEETATY